jgi:hypothetical protein
MGLKTAHSLCSALFQPIRTSRLLYDQTELLSSSTGVCIKSDVAGKYLPAHSFISEVVLRSDGQLTIQRLGFFNSGSVNSALCAWL